MPPALSAAPSPVNARDSVRGVFLRTRTGLVFIGAVLGRLAVYGIERAIGDVPALQPVGVLCSLAAAVAALVVIWRLVGLARRRFLWRVRRRLVLSYVLMGVVPSLLIFTFFLLAGFLLFFHISAFLFKNGIDDVVDEAMVVAQTAASELRRGGGLAMAQDVLDRKLANTAERYPGVSIALVRRLPPGDAATPQRAPLAVGPWEHVDPPSAVPSWVSLAGFGGLLAFTPAGEPDDTQLVVRAVGVSDERDATFAVVVDLPMDDIALQRVYDTTGIELKSIAVVNPIGDMPRPAPGRARRAPRPLAERLPASANAAWVFNSVTFFDYVDWDTGRTGSLAMSIRGGVGEVFQRLSAAQSRIKDFSLGGLVILVLGVIAAMFLVIEGVALIMGLALARSITGAIHELFEGTERVRSGDFSHRIRVRATDQLGQLSQSFNEMTGSIETLLTQAEEKKRLEEELRIAREIQMSLLPRGTLRVPGLGVTALCVPAKEVGGDYYDFFRLGETKVAVLIADVSGKGTSAALYMAELKGLVLSLSTIYQSPKQLLCEVNRIISDNLDSRSFITMTYAILDFDAGTLTHARAGHTPLIHVASEGTPRPRAALITPDGLVLGLRIEGVAETFAGLLTEVVLPLRSGDVFVFFTDGVTEAMNASGDLFGEDRLQAIVEEHWQLPADQLRERILREIESFVGLADQHDDMTMILMKVEDAGAVLRALPAAEAVPARVNV